MTSSTHLFVVPAIAMTLGCGSGGPSAAPPAKADTVNAEATSALAPSGAATAEALPASSPLAAVPGETIDFRSVDDLRGRGLGSGRLRGGGGCCASRRWSPPSNFRGRQAPSASGGRSCTPPRPRSDDQLPRTGPRHLECDPIGPCLGKANTEWHRAEVKPGGRREGGRAPRQRRRREAAVVEDSAEGELRDGVATTALMAVVLSSVVGDGHADGGAHGGTQGDLDRLDGLALGARGMRHRRGGESRAGMRARRDDLTRRSGRRRARRGLRWRTVRR